MLKAHAGLLGERMVERAKLGRVRMNDDCIVQDDDDEDEEDGESDWKDTPSKGS